jgi:phosphosulfolactate synthase
MTPTSTTTSTPTSTPTSTTAAVRRPSGPPLSALDLPVRTTRPRATGLTMVIDNGLPVGAFQDAVDSAGELIDLVKFGWGTALVTPRFDEKLACLRAAGIDWFLGGTLFEKHVAQGKVEEYRRLCHELGCRHVEVSNGTLPIEESRKAEYVARFAEEFTVLSEVGAKSVEGNARLRPRDWARQVRTDLAHGARWVITEARESGTTGIAGGDGSARGEVLDALRDSGVDPATLVFEAPTKALQADFVLRFGSDVNLGNIAPFDVVALETLRLGLRSDTMLDVLPDHAADSRSLTGGALRA